jgi:hypothetical protein
MVISILIYQIHIIKSAGKQEFSGQKLDFEAKDLYAKKL